MYGRSPLKYPDRSKQIHPFQLNSPFSRRAFSKISSLIVSKKAAARKQKRHDTGYALTANKLHSGRTGGFPQRHRCRLTAIQTANIRSTPPHLTYATIPPEQMEKGGHMEMRPPHMHCAGTDLSSQAASRQVLSALESLTTVFGMGTGGSSPPLAPASKSTKGTLKIERQEEK